jgi:threonyl-tRNA synthetase
MKNADNLDNIRHSLSHILATAVLKKFPKAKLAIGPVIEHGFYYDFKLPRPITEDDLKEFEKTMREIIRQNLSFSGKKLTPLEAKKIFKEQPFKLELIKDFTHPPKGIKKQPLTIYKTGEVFLDLCRGGHVKNTKEIPLEGFKLDKIAGAYWKGSEKNPMLTRIYGLAFNSKKELDEYIAMQEEAKKRDHREIGKRQNLFTFDDLVGPGLPLWLPNGTIIKDEIEKFAKEMENKYGYLRVSTPHIAKQKLFEISGHLPHYTDSMFPPMKLDDGNYYLKAMNCPIHHLIYKSSPRSYRDLPLRLAEYGTVYRNELSGTLAGLLRVRMLSMNDAHMYCRADQIEEEFKKVVELILYYFNVFGLKNYSFRLSCWDPKNKEKYINEPKNWKMSEDILRKILKNMNVEFTEVKNEAAFYGPKVDIQYRSVGGREETMSTIQLDFSAKKRFGLVYHDKDGKENGEVFVIHRSPLSTHERFIAYLIEHYAGEWPVWLAPVQARIIPIADRHRGYAEKVLAELKNGGIRADIAAEGETLGKNIRQGEMEKIPYLLVVGDKEIEIKAVNVRKRHEKNTATASIDEFVKSVSEEIKLRK